MLGIIAEKGPISPYSIRKLIEDYGGKVHYKNVHQSVKRLEELGLVVLANREEGGHAATNYVITTKGWGFLLSDMMFFFRSPMNTIAARHSGSPSLRKQFPESFESSIIYRELIAPYFEKTTIAILSEEAYHLLLVYLKECIDTIQNYKDMKFESIVDGSVTAAALKEIAETKLLSIASMHIGDDESLYEQDELKFRNVLLGDVKFHEYMTAIKIRMNSLFERYERMYKG